MSQQDKLLIKLNSFKDCYREISTRRTGWRLNTNSSSIGVKTIKRSLQRFQSYRDVQPMAEAVQNAECVI